MNSITITIASLTRRDVLTLAPATPIRRAAALLVETGTDAAPVLYENGAVMGIITQKDCFGPALHGFHHEWTGTVLDYMSRNPVCLPADMDLVRAAEAFASHPHRALVVVEGEQLVGLLLRSDVLAALSRWG